MDIGAYGVMVANVCSAREAQEAVNAVKYPPLGTRGVGLFRAQKFGVGFEDYKKWLAKESVVVIQIEHIDAVRDIDAIFSVKGIDAYLIGPYDLSGSMGKPGKFFDKDVEDAVKTVIAAGRRHKIPSGFHSVSSDADQALKRYKQGFQFIGFCVDSIFLCDAARNGLQKLKRMVR